MSHGKVKTGHWELAICLTVPIVVIAAICLSRFVYCGKQEKLLAQRADLLNLIPVLEQKLGAGQKALMPFVAPGAAKDMAADLSLCVSDAAQRYGLLIRSSSIEKQVGADSGAWADYKMILTGEGPLTSLIAMLDYLGQPQRRFRTVRVNFKTTQLTPETSGLVDLILVSRVMADRSDNNGPAQMGAITLVMAENFGTKLSKSTEGVNAWFAGSAQSLSLKNLQSRATHVPTDTVQIKVESQVSFHLTGVIRDKKSPMIMTDRGLFGVGDEVDGFKIESIGADTVILVSQSGRREILRLY